MKTRGALSPAPGSQPSGDTSTTSTPAAGGNVAGPGTILAPSGDGQGSLAVGGDPGTGQPGGEPPSFVVTSTGAAPEPYKPFGGELSASEITMIRAALTARSLLYSKKAERSGDPEQKEMFGGMSRRFSDLALRF